MVRSITTDPFEAIYFLEEEMGYITPQNQLFNENKRGLVKRYIDHYVKDYDVIGTVAMRSTHVEINHEKLCGLTFVTGILPKRDSFQSSSKRKYYWRQNQNPSIIYMPTQAYKNGEFIILEDVFAQLFTNIHTLFDEDLKIENLDALLDQYGDLSVKNDEDLIMLMQDNDLQLLSVLFETLLSTHSQYYDSLRPKVTDTVWSRSSFEGYPDLNFYGRIGDFGRGEEAYFGIYFPKLIMLASVRRLLKRLYPGTIDGEDTFDKQITRRLFAQYLYLDNGMNVSYIRENYGATTSTAIESMVRDGVDRHLEVIKKIESEAFMEVSFADKCLILDGLYEDMMKRLQNREEKDNGHSENSSTERKLYNSCGIETATDN